MSGLNIAAIGGGLKKGIQYDVQFMRNLAWAVKTGNTKAIAELGHIADVNAHEIAGALGQVTDAQVVALIFNPDVTQGSRQLMHDFEAAHGNH